MLLFDWDDANRAHIARHGVTPEEAEEMLDNEPFDLNYEIVGGEERFEQIGETARARVLIVVTTYRGTHIRVVTAFPPSRANLLKDLELRRAAK